MVSIAAAATRANFDQQPIEAQAMVSACLEAYRATSDFWWYEQAQRAFDWFIGWNDLGLELYSPESGGCGDGLHVDRVNGNQGAESTLAFLLSLAEMRLAQNMVTSFKEPIARSVCRDDSFHHAIQFTSAARAPSSSPTSRAFFCGHSIPEIPERMRPDHRADHVASGRPGRSSCWRKSPPSSPQRHQHIRKLFLERFEQVRECCWPIEELSEQRRLLIGSYFLAEYSLESAALFNPSIVPHPDQTGLASRRAALHSQPARHRRRAHFLHHVSNRYHPSRSSDRGIHAHRLPHRAASNPQPRL